jgi:hypothetical protein
MRVLPTPLGPSSTTFSVRSMNDRFANSMSSCRGAPLANSKS